MTAEANKEFLPGLSPWRGAFEILHLEDNPDDAEIVHRCLKNARLQCEIKAVENKIDLQNSLKYFDPHIILSDHKLPQFDYTEALAIVNGQESWRSFHSCYGHRIGRICGELHKKWRVRLHSEKNLTRLPNAVAQAVKQRKAKEDLEESGENSIAPLTTC